MTQGTIDIERLRTLYPTLSDEELKDAGARLSRYFACVLQIASDGHQQHVDKSERPDTIKERSNSSLSNIPFEHG